jgi:hypothetical protein
MSLQQIINRISGKARRMIAPWKVRAKTHPSIRRYMEFCRRKWPRNFPAGEDSVVLVGIFRWNPSVHCYAHFVNWLARTTGSSIRWFHFMWRRDYLYENIFSSFGTQRGLDMDKIGHHRAAAEKVVAEWFAQPRTNWDVVNFSMDGLQIGDLIFDTYLRAAFRPTVRVEDPALCDVMIQAVQIYLGVKEYFARHKVVGVVADHTVYIFSGLLARMAAAARIPVYQLYCDPDFYMVKIENDRKESDVALRYPWPQYKELFREMPPEMQARAREKGRESIEARLRGKKDGILLGVTAYGEASGQQVLENTGRPRILVLLNDFFDSVHHYRTMLFTDFYEWCHFLLSRAEQTPFDWYIKAHPNMLIYETWDRSEQARANQEIIDELRTKYPKVRFLPASVSNRQLIAEGVTAAFTMHSTAGHELAYQGIPVVNAGDNQHIAYPFNLLPKTLSEYEQCIAKADSLQIDMKQDDVAEYVYMNFFYLIERCPARSNPIPMGYFETEEYRERLSTPQTFDHMRQPLPAGEEEKLAAYFDKIVRDVREFSV